MDDRRVGADQLALLAIGVVAVSTAGPLIREADAPALAVASWRNLLAASLLVGFVAVRHRRSLATVGRRDRRLVVVSGLLLAGHFGTWVPSVGLTSVASSVALVSTQPVWTAVIARRRGEVVDRRTWLGIGLAVAGVLLLTGVDLTVSRRALAGDLLALAGGALAAAYFVVGAEVRRTVPTTVYTAGCYGVAAAVLAVVALAAGDSMSGYDGRTWWVLVALAAGPQLLGHSVFNRVLPEVGATVVSAAVLLEVVGATLLPWWWAGETPPAAAIPAGVVLLTGVAVVAGAGRRRRARTSPIGPL